MHKELDSIIYGYKNELMKIEISEQHRKIEGEEATKMKEKAAKETIKKIIFLVIDLY